MNKTTTLCLTAATQLLRSISKTLPMQNVYTPLRQGKRLTASVLLVFTFLFGYVGEGWGQVSNYTFSQSTGTYTTYTSTGVPAIGGNALNDDNSYNTISLPFAFTYNGTLYPVGSTIGINSNGFIKLGTGIANSYTAINSSNTQVIAGFNRDLQEQSQAYTNNGTWTSGASTITVANAAGWQVGMKVISANGIPAGSIVTAISGTTITLSQAVTNSKTNQTVNPASSLTQWIVGSAPNRSYVFQWVNYRRYGATAGQDNYSFQIWLNEEGGIASNQSIQVRYGTCTSTSTTAINPMVGLKGNSGTDFNSRTMGTWAASVASTANSQSMTHSNVVFPALGTQYTWNPPPSITSFSPLAICIGSTFTVTGTNLSSVSGVQVNNVAVASFTIVNATTINVSTTSTQTTGPVKLLYTGGSSTSATSLTINPLPVVTSSGVVAALCSSTSTQTSTLAYTATTNSPISYTIDWNAAANTAGLVDVSLTPFSFVSTGGSINIPVAANVAAGTYTGTMTYTTANGCSSVEIIIGSPFRCGISTGTTSSLKRPLFHACWERL